MPDSTIYLSQSRAAAKRSAQNFAEDVADGLRTAATLAAYDAALLIGRLKASGAGDISIGHVKAALHDAFGDIQGKIDRTMDDEGLAKDRHQIDLSELEDA